MSPRRRLDDWIDEDEYPSDKDVEDFGDDSPVDYHPRTVGYIGRRRPSFWTPGKITLLIVVLLMVAALVLPLLLGWLR